MVKKHLTIEQQVALLQERGMLIQDFFECSQALQKYGYYRLSGYWYQFRIREQIGDETVTREAFRPGTSFATILEIYDFDRKLRQLVFEMIEQIEVAMRFHIGHVLGKVDRYAHENASLFQSHFVALNRSGSRFSKHASLLNDIGRELNRSSEDFVAHHKNHHGGNLPIWAITEVMGFQHLCRLFGGIVDKQQNIIASNIGVSTDNDVGLGGTLLNWLENINHVRNLCAHHSRLWNRRMATNLKMNHLRPIPETRHIFENFRIESTRKNPVPNMSTLRIYATLTVLVTLNQKLALDMGWKERLVTHLHALPKPGSLSQMGFPRDWATQPVWSQ